MPDAIGLTVAAAAAGAVASFAIDALVTAPAARPWRRPAGALALHLGLWLVALGAGTLLLQRPVFAAAVALAGQLLVVLVSNAKQATLSEPFVFQDFEYFTDALRHPRLYIPFLGWWRASGAVAGFAAAAAAGFGLEAPLPLAAALLVAAALLAGGMALLALGERLCPPVAFDADGDIARLGLPASLWRYGLSERRPAGADFSASPFAGPAPDVGARPDIVVVQSESFFDARRHFSGTSPEVLAAFDGLKADGIAHGRLRVPAWGANTVRSEFAFLSGLAPETLGVHRFHPYRRLARLAPPTIASRLKALGYRTVCVHPYPAGFYDRDRVFPLLGFDEFIDIAAFGAADVDGHGPYVSDAALAAKVAQIVGARGEGGPPLFVFVITMENHGPLHLERVGAADVERFHASPPPPGCADLTAYLRHLAGADRMLALLRASLEALPREAWLCFFGDHVPIMPAVYAALGAPDGSSDYLIWRNRGSAAPEARDIDVAELGSLLLGRALARSG